MVCVSTFCSQIGFVCGVIFGIMYTVIGNLGMEYGV